jgi:hypothetical protein
LYLVHAGVAAVSEPTFLENGAPSRVTWDNRALWSNDWTQDALIMPARLVNALLFVLTLLAMFVLGNYHHSRPMGLTAATIFCSFPAVLECLPQPDIMLPVALLSWSIALAVMGGLGPLLASILLVLAGVAWPWAWLAVPMMLAYLLRRRVQAVAGVLGMAVALVGVVYGLRQWTAPTLPRADGVLAAAGQAPAFVATLAPDDRIALAANAPQPVEAHILKPFWSFLLQLDTASLGPDVISGEPRGALLKTVAPADAAAQRRLQTVYREKIEREPPFSHYSAVIRTLFECVWLRAPDGEARTRSAWALWSGDTPEGAARIATVRRIVKLVVGLLCLLVALALLRARQIEDHHFVGAFLVVVASTMIVSSGGAVANLAWLAAPLLAAMVVESETPALSSATRDAVQTRLIPPRPTA